ncbi:fumarylacetoacetase [Gordonia sp. HNM0687]|uniref:Fumarylacetoacetase n=1 Tax=Gordonia mangrovi TaxID=2665643 RepID=A0A6L7GP32_9ACTN|nr:fumarylacetoacetate hydrolase family protein [Gordonia mangrovi]MXP21674.1 fumarylacetoacetase [Gordonia mangrovi]UVF80409.1 fumarylacetoacetate hydrolase family protein [Gordonia mangrovi]
MSISVLRTADAWWVRDTTRAHRIATSATTTAELLAAVTKDRTQLEQAADDSDSVDIATLELISPVTTPCRVVAQMTNYVSHVKDSGMNPETVPLTFFRKASGSITGPTADVIKPEHVKLLDYEIELGLVIGEPIPVGTTLSATDLPRHLVALVITNDVSARDVQLPKTQFYEGKSYPSFTPVGPALVILEPGDLDQIDNLRLITRVNGEVRQDSTVADMIYSPLEALQALSRFQRLDTGDLILTGTPGGTALTAPPKPIEIIGSLLPPALKWKSFFSSQAKNPKYLRDGDVMELAIATDDGKLDLGVQRTEVHYS